MNIAIRSSSMRISVPRRSQAEGLFGRSFENGMASMSGKLNSRVYEVLVNHLTGSRSQLGQVPFLLDVKCPHVINRRRAQNHEDVHELIVRIKAWAKLQMRQLRGEVRMTLE